MWIYQTNRKRNCPRKRKGKMGKGEGKGSSNQNNRIIVVDIIE
jgi:hypothetical protein